MEFVRGKKVEMYNKIKKISIITVCYNSASTVEQTILSVLNQSYRNIEYIVIDGQSTDGTIEIINKYKDLIDVFVSEPDRGIYDAMNKGIGKATGDAIGIINSDDWYELDAVEKAVDCFESTDAELVYGKICNIMEDGSKVYSDTDGSLNELYSGMVTPHPSTFIRHEIYEKYGLFNTKYKIAADYELTVRLYTKGVKFRYIDSVMANFRQGGVSTTCDIECAEEKRAVSLVYINSFSGDRERMIEDIENKYHRAKAMWEIRQNPQLIVDYFNNKFVNFKNEIIVFGTGNCAKVYSEILDKCNIKVKFYVDNDSNRWGKKFKDNNIEKPEKLKDLKGHILIAVRYLDFEIENQLRSYNNYRLNWVTVNEMIESIQ